VSYQRLPSSILGFHGTDAQTVRKILNDPKTHLHSSNNDYDWLGGGIYFWENDPLRALQFAKERMKWKGQQGKEPGVIGAIIDLGLCFNLFDQPALKELAQSYEELSGDFASFGIELPRNGRDGKLWSRNRDCLVIDHVHDLRKEQGLPAYDTVRSAFQEGEPVFPGTEFRKKHHIQIAVRNTACIKGYFLPQAASK
jgi:hypothetical protein